MSFGPDDDGRTVDGREAMAGKAFEDGIKKVNIMETRDEKFD